MEFLIVATLGALGIAILIRIVRDSSRRARYHEIGEGVVLNLKKLFHLVYPGYVCDDKIEFRFFCQRRWLLWGAWKVVFSIRFDGAMQLDVRAYVMERLNRIGRNKNFQEKVILQPIFERFEQQIGREKCPTTVASRFIWWKKNKKTTSSTSLA